MKWMVWSVLVVSVLCGGMAYAVESHIENEFYAAHKQYEEGAFSQAIETYQGIVDQGYESGALYYNMGNAYYRLDKIGMAIVYYERAHRLMPKDEDLFANMTHVRSLLVEQQPEDSASWYGRVFNAVRDALSATGWLVVLVGVYVLFMAGCILSIFLPRFRHSMIVLFALVCVSMVAVFTISKIHYTEKYRAAVVVDDEVAVRYSPAYDGAVAFKMHEGIKAQVVQEGPEWTLVRLGKGRSGWVESGSVEIV